VLQDLGDMKPLEPWIYPLPQSLPLLLETQGLMDDGKSWFKNPDTKNLIRDDILSKIFPILRPWLYIGEDRGYPRTGSIIIGVSPAASNCDDTGSSCKTKVGAGLIC